MKKINTRIKEIIYNQLKPYKDTIRRLIKQEKVLNNKYKQELSETNEKHKIQTQGLNIIYGVFYIKDRNSKFDYYGPLDGILSQGDQESYNLLQDIVRKYPGSKISMLPNFYKSKYYGQLFPTESYNFLKNY